MPRSRRILLGSSFLALVAIFFVLIGGVNDLKLLPGKSLPNPFAGTPDVAPGEEGPGLKLGVETIRPLVQLMVILSIVIVAVFAVISPRFRRHLFVVALILGVFYFAFTLIEPLKQPMPEEIEDPLNLAGGGAPPREPVRVEIPEVRGPSWGVILMAIGISLAVTGLGMLFMVKVYPTIKAQRDRRKELLEELGERASEAVARIHAGDDPREVVLWCYKEMSDILSRQGRVQNYSYLTPREFSRLLLTRGMKSNHADRLTSIFEQVRYGNRRGKPFAAEAIACLEAIRHTYAPIDLR